MSFSKLYGQQGPIDVLKRAVEKRRVPHAFLFFGAGGVGKRTTAFVFAKALNCETGGADACDACASCRKYIKTVDTRVLGRRSYPPLEQIASLHLDIKAAEAGYAAGIPITPPR